MDPQELIGQARRLAGNGGAGVSTPSQADLRRAISAAYYAMFHTLCRICADELAGADAASADRESWLLAYRALEHGYTKNRFENYGGMRRFRPEVREFGKVFREMQVERQTADYNPDSSFVADEVSQLVEDIARRIDALTSAPRADLRALALYLLLRPRRE